MGGELAHACNGKQRRVAYADLRALNQVDYSKVLDNKDLP